MAHGFHPNEQTTLPGRYDVVAGVTVNPDGTVTKEFVYTGAEETWVVPGGVTSLTIECFGAGGGKTQQYETNSNTSSKHSLSFGGAGAYVKGTYTSTPGETLRLYVGGVGSSFEHDWTNASQLNASTSAGGFNGGGESVANRNAMNNWSVGGPGGGGGGGTDVRQGGAALNDRIIVAGGGGGASGMDAGQFGTPDGGGGGGIRGTNTTYPNGVATANTVPRSASQNYGGDSTSRFGSNDAYSNAGAFGVGGNAYQSNITNSPGGGGGGGWYGGSGGWPYSGSVGGDSGSSYVGNGNSTLILPWEDKSFVTIPEMPAGRTGNGLIRISWASG